MLTEGLRGSVIAGYRHAVMTSFDLDVKAPPSTRIMLAGIAIGGELPYATEVNLVRPDPDPLRLLED